MENLNNILNNKFNFKKNTKNVIKYFQLFNNVKLELKNGFLKATTGIEPIERNFGIILKHEDIQKILGKKVYFIIKTCTEHKNTFQAIIYQRIHSKWSILKRKTIKKGNNTTIMLFEIDKNVTNLWLRIDTIKPDSAKDIYIDYWIVTDGFYSFNNNEKIYEQDYNLIIKSGLFDMEYYLDNYLNKFENPIIHYLKYGWEIEYNPSDYFDTKYYREKYITKKDKNINPLIHYIKYGIENKYLPKIWTIDSLRNNTLKKSLQGKNHYFFLINDSNNEIKQHFDKEYISKFNAKKYNAFIKIKKEYLSKQNIDYYLFSVPDKTIVCKKFLPFEVNIIKRNINSIDYIIDFLNEMNPTHFFKYDSHLNFYGGKILAFKYLNYIDNSFSWSQYEKIIHDGEIKSHSQHMDMFSDLNWSYPNYIRNKFDKKYVFIRHVPKNLEKLNMPEKFEYNGRRKSKYYKNKDSYSNARVLILHDSCTMFLKDYLLFYFKEVFLYWDHGIFNKDLVEWLKPDIVIEIRIERFLEDVPIHEI